MLTLKNTLVENVLKNPTVLLVLNGILMLINVSTENLVPTKNTGMKNNRDVSGILSVLIQCTTYMMNVLKIVTNST